MARATASRTLWATRMGWTRKGPISTGEPGTSGRVSALRPRSTRRRFARRSVRGVAKTGAGAASRAQASAPMWSSCPWVSTMPRTASLAFGEVGVVRYHRVDPGHLGAREEQSRRQRAEVCPSHSTTREFRPNSPSPPRGINRIGELEGAGIIGRLEWALQSPVQAGRTPLRKVSLVAECPRYRGTSSDT